MTKQSDCFVKLFATALLKTTTYPEEETGNRILIGNPHRKSEIERGNRKKKTVKTVKTEKRGEVQVREEVHS